jgi:hypothetical protein
MMGGKMPDNSPEWLPLLRPCYQAAALVFTALQTLGDYPADSPDYDPVAVDHLRKALQRLAPGLGNMEILGAPHPVKPRLPITSQRPARDDETQQAPADTVPRSFPARTR